MSTDQAHQLGGQAVFILAADIGRRVGLLAGGRDAGCPRIGGFNGRHRGCIGQGGFGHRPHPRYSAAIGPIDRLAVSDSRRGRSSLAQLQ